MRRQRKAAWRPRCSTRSEAATELWDAPEARGGAGAPRTLLPELRLSPKRSAERAFHLGAPLPRIAAWPQRGFTLPKRRRRSALPSHSLPNLTANGGCPCGQTSAYANGKNVYGPGTTSASLSALVYDNER